MRISAVGILFFVLFAVQIAVRALRPTPAPAWTAVVVIVTAAGMILCLTVPPLLEWLRRRRGTPTPTSQEDLTEGARGGR